LRLLLNLSIRNWRFHSNINFKISFEGEGMRENDKVLKCVWIFGVLPASLEPIKELWFVYFIFKYPNKVPFRLKQIVKNSVVMKK